MFIVLNEGGEAKLNTNINYLLEQFGISCNSDSVVRTSYYKYLHPKETYISHGVLSQDFARLAQGMGRSETTGKGRGGYADAYKEKENDDPKLKQGSLDFVYPYGATLNIQKPAFPILSTGPVSYPTNRPILAAYQDQNRGGRLLVLGSVRFLDDEFCDKECNSKLIDGMLRFLTRPPETSEIKDAVRSKEENGISEYHRTPDTSALSDSL